MAVEALTATHRKAQLALRAKVIRDLHRIWPALRWDDIERTFPLWATVASTLIARNRATSSAIASSYYRALRFQQGVTDPLDLVIAEPLPAAQVQTSLRVTSLVSIKAAAARGIARDAAMANAFVTSSGSISRLVLDAGRETIRATAIADPRSEGWQRITSGRACTFCSTLAGQGAVYREATADFQAHDHCGCTAQPVFR
jgi:hypothetical protein